MTQKIQDLKQWIRTSSPQDLELWPWGIVTLRIDTQRFLISGYNVLSEIEDDEYRLVRQWSDPANAFDPASVPGLTTIKAGQQFGQSEATWNENLARQKRCFEEKQRAFGVPLDSPPFAHPLYGANFLGAAGGLAAVVMAGEPDRWSGFECLQNQTLTRSAQALSNAEIEAEHRSGYETRMGLETVDIEDLESKQVYSMSVPFYHWPVGRRFRIIDHDDQAAAKAAGRASLEISVPKVIRTRLVEWT